MTAPVFTPKMHYTYLITDGGKNTKIGHSRRPRQRMSQLGVGSPVKLELAHVWSGSRERQIQLEVDLHFLFRWARVSGEWHRLPHWDIVPIGDALAAGDTERAARGAEILREESSIDQSTGDIKHIARLRRELIALGLSGNSWDQVFLA